MAKFDFNNSRYARFWDSSDARYVRTYIDTMISNDLLRMNNRFWTTQFTINGDVIPTNDKGVAAFQVDAVDKSAAPMMDLRGRLGDANQLDKEGAASYLSTIPDFITPGWRENALERYNKAKRFEEVGNDAIVIQQWTNSVQTLLDSANSTMSNMGAQLLSTGKIFWDFGRGIKGMPVQKADIPARNFLKAGEKVWADPDCLLLDQMVKRELEWREEAGGFDGTMKWQIPYNTFYNVFMKNAQVKDIIKQQRTLNEEITTTGMMFTQEQVLRYISLYPNLSPIEVIEEKQYDLGWETGKMVHGWAESNVVLRPTGFAGEIFRTDQLDRALHELFGATSVSKVFTEMESGLFTLVNTSMNNGDYKEWQTHMIMSAVPSLSEFPYHVIVDITKAD